MEKYSTNKLRNLVLDWQRDKGNEVGLYAVLNFLNFVDMSQLKSEVHKEPELLNEQKEL